MIYRETRLLLSLTLLVILLGCQSLLAQESVYQFASIDSRQGLSSNQINSILKDEKGFLWFGTMSGLNRYDGYTFKIFKHKIGDTTTLNDDYVSNILQGPGHSMLVLTPNGWNVFNPKTEKFSANAQALAEAIGTADETFTNIVQDKQKNFWLVYPGKGLYKYTSVAKTGRLYNAASKPLKLYSNNVNYVMLDRDGFLWVVYAEGVLEKIETVHDAVVFQKKVLPPLTNNQNLNYKLFVDRDNDLWINLRGDAKGVYYYKPAQNELLLIDKDAPHTRLNNNIVKGITQDGKGIIWIATDHGGVNLIDKKDLSVRYLVANEADAKSLSQNSISALYKDVNGIIWIGTYKKGVNFFHENNVTFPLYQHQPGNAASLMYNDINKFVEDRHGNLWIGTNGGGLIYFDRKAGSFTQYLHNPNNAASLTNNVIVSLIIDHEGKLWIGTYYGGMDCFDGKTFTHYRHDDKNPSSLADNRVWEIFEDSQHRFWIGTLSEGLELFDPKAKMFTHFKPGMRSNSLKSSYVSSILEDRFGNIWLSTSFGIDMLDPHTGLFRHLEHVEGDSNSLNQNNVIELREDSRGLIWAATRDGLAVYDPQKKKFTTYRTEDGLPDNFVLTVLEDHNHDMWVTTASGLSKVMVSFTSGRVLSLHFKNYDETDGLQGRLFNENAALTLTSGELAVGGANGFNLFRPSAAKQSKAAPGLVLTDLQIFNNSVKVGEVYDGKVVLPQSIAEAKELTLHYDQNVFTIEFSALEFLNADKIKYAYKLLGFKNEWLTTDAKARKATFTNLNPGTYTLLIRASNNDGEWSNEPLLLTIRVLPPFWLTPYAFILYALLVLGALFVGRQLILRRAKAKFALEQERQEAQRLHELDMMKIKFFTNVSHEFRTPLSLILSPVEKLLKASVEKGEKKQFQLIHQNARRLLNLVNQLMDFRKMEEQELQLNKTPGDVIRFIRETASSFSDIAENKKIAFSVHSTDDNLLTTFDHDKLERILFNLLSNAFKFTPVGGAVKVVLECLESAGAKMLQIKVIDTGIGISKDKQEKIFERFFQNEVPGVMVNQGSGIGLAITKEFVRMHGGTVDVESETDRGSCFTVALPLAPVEVAAYADDAGEELAESRENPPATVLPELSAKAAVENTVKGRRKTILLVEDNDDFRFYIKDNLIAHYQVIEAQNGKIGWQKTLAEHPDLIVCDISMPEMNGIELCQKIKCDSRTSFIPVLLLTAITGEEQQLVGLQTGANDYMTKPFNFEILLSKIRNLLLQQESFKKTYQKQVQAQPSEMAAVESADEKFMRQVLTVIEKNIANPDFSVEELSREVFMSRVALYKKLFALSGKTPLEFIRSIRLQRAAQLLQKKELTVAEVAYEVGFNNPKYFSKYFKIEFNVLPSSYPAGKDGETDTAHPLSSLPN